LAYLTKGRRSPVRINLQKVQCFHEYDRRRWDLDNDGYTGEQNTSCTEADATKVGAKRSETPCRNHNARKRNQPRKQEAQELWTEWIVRATQEVERHCEGAGVEDWVRAQRRSNRRWAGHVARLADNRWTQRLLHWVPWRGRRSRRRPSKRWSDEVGIFVKHLDGDVYWEDVALDRVRWKTLATEFVQR
jgi:hypothetical protein